MCDLSDGMIRARLLEATSDKRLVIDPLEQGSVGPVSVDLRLGPRFFVDDVSHEPFVDAELDNSVSWQQVECPVFHLMPGEHVRNLLMEYIRFPRDVKGLLVGRSTAGRNGVQVINSPVFNPGWSGYPLIELANNSRRVIRLRPGTSVCQMCFTLLAEPAQVVYGEAGTERYQNQGV